MLGVVKTKLFSRMFVGVHVILYYSKHEKDAIIYLFLTKAVLF
jgi:hypothetical protein